MISAKVLLDIVATEALEIKPSSFHEYRHMQSESKTNLPPIRYNLELIRQPDGSLKWVE